MNAASCAKDLGGKGANQAVAAARHGPAVRLWAALGQDDRAGAAISARLAQEGIATPALKAFDLPSDRSTIVVDAPART